MTPVRLGAYDVVSPDQIRVSDPILNAANEHFDSPEEGLAELKRLYSNKDNIICTSFSFISYCAAYFGDHKFTLEVMERSVELNGNQTMFVWPPVMKEVRQLPRFKALVKKIGLVDYWNKFGWPDMCHKLDNGDFVCD